MPPMPNQFTSPLCRGEHQCSERVPNNNRFAPPYLPPPLQVGPGGSWVGLADGAPAADTSHSERAARQQYTTRCLVWTRSAVGALLAAGLLGSALRQRRALRKEGGAAGRGGWAGGCGSCGLLGSALRRRRASRLGAGAAGRGGWAMEMKG